jgi:hypothetical protein
VDAAGDVHPRRTAVELDVIEKDTRDLTGAAAGGVAELDDKSITLTEPGRLPLGSSALLQARPLADAVDEER